MYELKISLEKCTRTGKRMAMDAIRKIAKQDTGKRELLAEALLKESKKYCDEMRLTQNRVEVPYFENENWQDEEGRNQNAAYELDLIPGAFSHLCIDTLVDFIAFLSAIPEVEQDDFAKRLLDIVEKASVEIDEIARKEKEEY